MVKFGRRSGKPCSQQGRSLHHERRIQMTNSAVADIGVSKKSESVATGHDRDGKGIAQVVSFRLANEVYGLNIMNVQEIILPGEITQIPEVPSYIRGLINLRGQVIPIVDLRKRFELDAEPATEHTRIVVVNTSAGITFGVVVDAVTEVLRVEPSQVEPPPTGLAGLERSYIRGLLKQEERIMILLNMECVLSQDDHALLEKNSGA
jgi:purine-binding chemotaxis protein CheW